MIKPLLIQLRSNIFAKDKQSAISNIENIFNSLEPLKNEPVIYEFLFFCVTQIRSFIENENFSQAYDLTDCIHVIPDIISASEKEWKAYWEIYVEEYAKKYNDNSLAQFKESITAL